MKGHWFAKTLQILIVLLVVIAGFGQAVLQLWNWLMPTLFGLPTLTFWRAVGLMGLCWILFGGLRGGRALPGWHRPMRGRFESLTPEERERFLRGLAAQGGPAAPSAT
jgi:hypothetical protein